MQIKHCIFLVALFFYSCFLEPGITNAFAQEESEVLRNERENDVSIWLSKNIDKAWEVLFTKKCEEENKDLLKNPNLEWNIYVFIPQDRFFDRECAFSFTKIVGKEVVHIMVIESGSVSVMDQLGIMHLANPNASLDELLPMVEIYHYECESTEDRCKQFRRMIKRLVRMKITPIPPDLWYLDAPQYEIKITTGMSTVEYSICGHTKRNMKELCDWVEDMRELILGKS